MLKKINISANEVVMDPWNGSGTTTSVCSNNGIRSIGIDLNPAMKPIAAVRCMSSDDLQDVFKFAMQALVAEPDAVDLIFPFAFCGRILNRAKQTCNPSLHDGLRFGFMAACRALARAARSKNPTWYSLQELRSIRISSALIRSEIASSFAALQNWKRATPLPEKTTAPLLLTANWTSGRWRRKASHIITSPPYLTRIDYVMKTLPELLLLNEEESIDLKALRNEMLGGVLTKEVEPPSIQIHSAVAQNALSMINKHNSKASSTYYYRFFHQYFSKLQRSLSKIATSPTPPQTMTIVTQGSYYKEIFVDLPQIIEEYMLGNGYRLASKFAFLGSNNMVTVNSRSAASSLCPPAEIAAMYERM